MLIGIDVLAPEGIALDLKNSHAYIDHAECRFDIIG